MTVQRREILAALRRTDSHPTADELFRQVRQRLPRVSLGTVYRTLDLLARAGEVVRVAGDGGQMRFDGRCNEHFHVRCERCGRVEDLAMERPSALIEPARAGTDYRLSGYDLVFRGVCPRCARTARPTIGKGSNSAPPDGGRRTKYHEP